MGQVGRFWRLDKGHQRSSATTIWHSTYDFLFDFNRNYASSLYCSWVIASYLSKVSVLTYPTCICRPRCFQCFEGLLFWCWLTHVDLEKRLLNGCSFKQLENAQEAAMYDNLYSVSLSNIWKSEIQADTELYAYIFKY